MITIVTPLTGVNQDAERRRALAKVYDLLIKLAEEEHQTTPSPGCTDEVERKDVEPTFVQLELLH